MSAESVEGTWACGFSLVLGCVVRSGSEFPDETQGFPQPCRQSLVFPVCWFLTHDESSPRLLAQSRLEAKSEDAELELGATGFCPVWVLSPRPGILLEYEGLDLTSSLSQPGSLSTPRYLDLCKVCLFLPAFLATSFQIIMVKPGTTEARPCFGFLGPPEADISVGRWSLEGPVQLPTCSLPRSGTSLSSLQVRIRLLLETRT